MQALQGLYRQQCCVYCTYVYMNVRTYIMCACMYVHVQMPFLSSNTSRSCADMHVVVQVKESMYLLPKCALLTIKCRPCALQRVEGYIGRQSYSDMPTE